MFRACRPSRQVYRPLAGPAELSVKYNHALCHIETLERDLANARQLLFHENAGFPLMKHQQIEVKWQIRKGLEEIKERLNVKGVQLEDDVQIITQRISNTDMWDLPLLQSRQWELESAKVQLNTVQYRQKMCDKDLYLLPSGSIPSISWTPRE